ncbi:MAG: histone [Chlamydiales bacterium]|nr:histone [Chlamydiales bacterium]
MALNNTVKQMRELLSNITEDLEKAVNGNKAAAQRVRTGSIRFEKVAKQYRKESIASEKRGTSKKTTSKKTTSRRTTTTKKATSRTASKSKAKKATKRSTAKLPTRRRSARAR